MRCRTLVVVIAAGTLVNAATAQTSQLVCETWHPRLGQMNDISFAVDVQQQTCNGNPCKISERELRWSESGGRYEYVLNRLSGEGQVRLYGASEPTTVLKNCRASEKKS
jgi:hypothetical protein